jgi:hypothetical protein
MAQRLTTTRTRNRLRRPRQLELILGGDRGRPLAEVRSWGGKREGAGRPRVPGSISHAARPKLASRFPVHVTLKVDPSLPNLRTKQLLRAIELCFLRGKEREGFRLVHYSVQRHHLHLIVEASSASALGAGIKGLCVRMARRLNAALGRKGRVFVQRYFARILKTPAQTKAALAHVLLNCRRHDRQRGRVRSRGWVDPCSSGRFFDGWREVQPRSPPDEEPCVALPRLWLLVTGWKLRGRISVDEVPGQR